MAIWPNTHTNIDSLHIRQTLKILLRVAQSEGGTGEQGCGEESITISQTDKTGHNFSGPLAAVKLLNQQPITI